MKELWYQKPAVYWEEALPVGNGRLGGMVYGNWKREVIQLNEETIWSGKPIDRHNPDALTHLDEIRKLVFAGNIKEAEQLADYALTGLPESMRAYQTFGELLIEHDYPEGVADPESYRRSLNLDQAVVTSKWTLGGTSYQQEVFASVPDDVLSVRLQAEGTDKLNFSCRLERGKLYDRIYAVDQNTIVLEGNSGGLLFAGALSCITCDGEVETIGEYLLVRNASEVVLLFSAATDFRVENPAETALSLVRKHNGEQWETLFKRHLADYEQLYGKLELEFGASGADDRVPTDERIRRFAETGTDIDLVSLYFQFGRYLMISGSRRGGLPLTLQGIWNEDFTPPWESKYTININLEMNYWPAEICGLEECTEPFFALLKRMFENGKVTAAKMYGCRGFMAHHNTDIYADTAPQDRYIPATYWVLGGAWMSLHIWEHYQFTKDLDFLAEHYEILQQAVQFFEDFLVEDLNGYLVTCPSVSPENTYILKNGNQGRMCDAPTMDNQILWQLFDSFISAAKELEKEDSLVAVAEQMKKRIPGPQIGSEGLLLEWKEEYEETEPGHRHISHLYGLFPGSQITPEDTPKLAEAARNTLDKRLKYGGGQTGWSRAWIILLWNRFKEGELAYENLKKLISHSTFSNMMDFHPMGEYKRGNIFQIDGNLGGITGIAEMLVQSHNGRIDILPALPKALGNGRVKGLRVRGNASVEMEWQKGKLKQLLLLPESDLECKLCYCGKAVVIALTKNKRCLFDGELNMIQ